MKKSYDEVNNSIGMTKMTLLDFIHIEKKTEPHKQAIKVAGIYGAFGLIWVFLTDVFIHYIISDIRLVRKISLFKGWIFVIVSMLMIYELIKKFLVSFKNITKEVISAYEELENIAYYNSLTGLPNRQGLELEAIELMNGKGYSNSKMALVYLDIDNFKYVNDTLGHKVGDKLLRYIANILKYHIERPNVVANVGSDDFVILFANILSREDITTKVQEIQKLFRLPWIMETNEIYVTTSIGVAIYPEHGSDLPMLFKNAEIAMYYTKKINKDDYNFYSDTVADQTLEYTWMTNALRIAIKNKNIMPYYQPLIDLNTGEITGAEVLSRWLHNRRGWISPIEFIPVAEACGLIYEIDNWILENALNQMRIWNKKGYHNMKLSVNFSSKTLMDSRLLTGLKQTLDKYDLNYTNIQIEITETAVINDLVASIEILNKIKSLGIKIALDDFGTGYSSLIYLKTLPIDVIKLDASFIKNILDENEEDEIINTIIQLGHVLNKTILAEGIETKEQLKFLIKHKCDIGQGYLFSHPIPADEFEGLLKTKTLYI